MRQNCSVGLLALINESLGKNVGYINPLLYPATAEPTFHDITSGSKGDYSADKGWDAFTGLGNPNVSAFLTALGALNTRFRELPGDGR